MLVKEWIILICGILLALIILYKHKREHLEKITYYFVIQAEELFKNGHGKEKLQFVIKKLKEKIPWYFSILISEKVIIEIIENTLKILQEFFKDSKEKQLLILDKVLEVTEKRNYDNLIEVTEVMKKEVEDNGYIEGFLKIKSNFKGNHTACGGIKAKIKL